MLRAVQCINQRNLCECSPERHTLACGANSTQQQFVFSAVDVHSSPVVRARLFQQLVVFAQAHQARTQVGRRSGMRRRRRCSSTCRGSAASSSTTTSSAAPSRATRSRGEDHATWRGDEKPELSGTGVWFQHCPRTTFYSRKTGREVLSVCRG